MSLAEKSAKTFFLRLVTLALQVPTSVMLARFLGVEGKGNYTLLTVIPWLVAFVLLFGLDTAQTYLLSGRQTTLRALGAVNAVVVPLLSLFAGAIYLFIIAPRVMASVPREMIWLSLALIPVVLSRYLAMAALLGLEQVIRFNLLYIYTSFSILVLAALLVGWLGYGLDGAFIAFLTSQALVLFLCLFWLKRSSAQESQSFTGVGLQGWELFKKSIFYGLKGHAAGVLVTFNQRFDIFILGALSSPREVGLYAVAVAVAEVVWHVPMSVHLNLFPRVAAAGADEGAKRLPRAVRMTLLLSAVIALGLFFLGKPAIGILFGSSFLPSSGSMLALLPGVVAVSVASVFESYFAGIDRRHYQSYSVACAFVLGLALDLLLIPGYGALGAAIASTASYTLQMIISIILFRKIREIAWGEFFLPTAKDAKDLLATLSSFLKSLKEERFRSDDK